MTPKLISNDVPVRIDQIVVKDRLRPVSEAGVETIVASVGELGIMKDAIHVRKFKSGELRLMAGAHRLEAAKRLDWPEITPKIWSCTNDWALLMEIDDNLAGAELGALDTAVFLAARKQVYEKLHPETKAAVGKELVAKRWDTADTMSTVSFAKVTAEKFGLTDRHVRRLVAAGEALTSDEIRWLRAAPKAPTLSDLGTIAKIEDPHERSQSCILFSNGSAKNIASARQQWRTNTNGAQPVKASVEGHFLRLRQAFERAPKEARLRFVRQHLTDLTLLIRDIERGEDEA